uniref:Retrotransposon Copia-like N-terminal domain-containing protein n=1 Tax=Cannabis sativa TaxID=3483 RepID=A0A803PQM4_CANSA
MVGNGEKTPRVVVEGDSTISGGNGGQKTTTRGSQTQTPSIFVRPFGSTLNHPFALKLDRINFPLWRTMVYVIVRGHRLDGYLKDGIASEVLGCGSLSALWSILEALYGSHSKAKMDQCRTKIQTARKDVEYYLPIALLIEARPSTFWQEL